MTAETTVELPADVRALFWDCAPGSLSFDRHRAFVVNRILARGSWEAIQWLRRTAGDQTVRAVIRDSRGRHLSPRQLRFWQRILGLPSDEIDDWLNEPARRVWNRPSA